MGKRNKVTTRDIAEYTGVSQSTVSMILSKKPNVSFSPDTVKKVEEAAKQLNYKKPEEKQKKKIMNLSQAIVVFSPTLSNGYYTMLTQYIVEQARKYDYKVFQIATLRDMEQEEEYLKLLAGIELAGIIFTYPPEKLTLANALSRQVPVVSIGDKPDTSRFDSVELDSTKPGYLIGEHLLSLGHQKITYITPPIKAKEIGRVHRLEGLKRSFTDRGLDPEECIRIAMPSKATYGKYPTDNQEYVNGYQQTMEALKTSNDSTAFVGNNDITAFGIMAAIVDCGYRIPADYSVCGFDNLPLSSMPQVSLTTIEHASAHKGREAVDMIYRKNQQKQESGKHQYIMRMEYEPELIIRKTTGKRK